MATTTPGRSRATLDCKGRHDPNHRIPVATRKEALMPKSTALAAMAWSRRGDCWLDGGLRQRPVPPAAAPRPPTRRWVCCCRIRRPRRLVSADPNEINKQCIAYKLTCYVDKR